MIVRSQCGVKKGVWADPSQRGQSLTTVLSGRHLPIRKLYRGPIPQTHQSPYCLITSSIMAIDALFIYDYVSLIYVDAYVAVNSSPTCFFVVLLL